MRWVIESVSGGVHDRQPMGGKSPTLLSTAAAVDRNNANANDMRPIRSDSMFTEPRMALAFTIVGGCFAVQKKRAFPHLEFLLE